MSTLKASIVIDSYNYDKYLAKAIESALTQTYPNKEIIVVDDGSTDHSPEIIRNYENEIISLLKENGGQPSAINEGVRLSSGDIIFFLDSDDTFYPDKVEQMIELYQQILPQQKKAFLYHRLDQVTSDGDKIRIKPKNLRDLNKKKVKGDLIKLYSSEEVYKHVSEYGFMPFIVSPTSGLSMTREMATEVFPIPEVVPLWPDAYFVKAAMLLGDVYGTDRILGSFTLHGKNWHKVTKNSTNYLKEHCESQNEYLNGKLKKIGKKSIVSFFDSIYCKSYYEKHRLILPLLKLAYKVPMRKLNVKTILFAIKVVCWSVRLIFIKILKK